MDEAQSLLFKSPESRYAQLILRSYSVPVNEYARELYSHSPQCELEGDMRQALLTELVRLGICEGELTMAIDQLERSRVISTTAHTALSNGPAFFASNWLASLGLEPNRPYIAATYSGIPFSNDARPGCLNYSSRHSVDSIVRQSSSLLKELKRAEKERDNYEEERRVSCVPSSYRDMFVYRSRAPKKLEDMFRSHLVPTIGAMMPDFEKNGEFSTYALKFSASMEAKILGRPVIYLDLNSIVASYLVRVIGKERHYVHHLLYDKNTLKSLEKILGHLSLFYFIEKPGRRPRKLYVKDGYLLGDTGTKLSAAPEDICAYLENGRLCPSLFLSFISMAFLNDFFCLGSFGLVEYLEQYRRALGAVGVLDRADVSASSADGLTIGRCLSEDGLSVSPIDILLGTSWQADESITLGEFTRPVTLRKRWMRTING